MKKFLLLASIISILIVCCFLKTKQIIDIDFIDKDLLILRCKDDMSFIFDTGANETILYSDTIPSSFFHISDIKAKDVFSEEYSMKRYYSFKTNIGGIENCFTLLFYYPLMYKLETQTEFGEQTSLTASVGGLILTNIGFAAIILRTKMLILFLHITKGIISITQT